MPGVMSRLRWLLDIFIRSVQKVLIVVFLLLTYFLAMGATYVVALVFRRDLLRGGKRTGHTYWTDPGGCARKVHDCLRQS